jgi:hypothetical protein
LRDAADLAVGSMVGAVALMLATGSDDEDRPYLTGTLDRRDAGGRSLGYRDVPPQSILVGDTYYSYSRSRRLAFHSPLP